MVRWAVGSWTASPEPGDSKTCKEATIKVQATGGVEGRVFRGKLGGQTTMLSASEDTEVGKEAQRRSRLGWGGPLEHVHSIHSVPRSSSSVIPPPSHMGAVGSAAPPAQLGQCRAQPTAQSVLDSRSHCLFQADSPCQIDEQCNKGGNHIIPECILIKIK